MRNKPDVAGAGRLAAPASATNFATVDCGDGTFAPHVLDALIAGVFVRMPFVAPQNRAIRIGCGRPEELDIVEQELAGALAAASGSR